MSPTWVPWRRRDAQRDWLCVFAAPPGFLVAQKSTCYLRRYKAQEECLIIVAGSLSLHRLERSLLVSARVCVCALDKIYKSPVRLTNTYSARYSSRRARNIASRRSASKPGALIIIMPREMLVAGWVEISAPRADQSISYVFARVII